MNEKYLWDKTGADAEIERLENSLEILRFREHAAPRLPAKIIPFAAKMPRRFSFRFAYALAACAVLFAAAFGVWLSVSRPIPTNEIETAQANLPAAQTSAPISELPKTNESKSSTVTKTNVPNVKKIAAPNFAVERKIVEKPKTVRVNTSKNELFAENRQPKQRSVKLTREEKYAYDQLMLALSITSSKLKIVKDKSEGASLEIRVADDGK